MFANQLISHALSFILATLLILLSSSTGRAKDEVVITGTVTEVSVRGLTPKRTCEFWVTLQFRNDSSEAVIIPHPRIAKSRLVFIKDYSASSANSEIDGVLFRRDEMHPSYSPKRDPIDVFLEFLTRKGRPSEYAFLIIPAGGYTEYPTSFEVENGCKFKEEPPEDPLEKAKIVAIPEYGGMKIEYRLSLSDRTNGVELVDQARRLWKPFGRLLFEDDGNFSIKSGFITNISIN